MSAPREGAVYVSPRTGAHWQAAIGLEVHCRLKTLTKLFCGCANRYGAPPNSLTCPVCSGQPGALPVLGSEALELALRVALALGAEIAPRSRFERKHYFYGDLPKGFQITQVAHPLCSGGGIDFSEGEGDKKRLRLTRIHLEEDAGKALHDRGAETLIDLNRAGVPLIECVTEPELSGAEEAHACLRALKQILQYVGASDCDMEKGSLRCDVNVSVHPPGAPLSAKIELKNLNSFAHVRSAIAHEIARQVEVYETGGAIAQETRLFDATRGETRTLRAKEEADDYRYFPEPDLPWVQLDAEQIEAQRQFLPELPAARLARYRRELGLSAYDAGVLCATQALADFFEATARLSGSPKEAANWIANDLLRHLADPAIPAGSVDALPFRPQDLADLIALARTGRISIAGGRKLLETMVTSGHAPGELVQALDLEQVTDAARIEAWCRAALAQGADALAAIRGGDSRAVDALIGEVMRASGGRADPHLVRETLQRLIEEAP